MARAGPYHNGKSDSSGSADAASILHPTDIFFRSERCHARAPLAAKSELHLLHITERDVGAAQAFPPVRRLLVQWGLAAAESAPP
jgi:hypothetical protein